MIRIRLTADERNTAWDEAIYRRHSALVNRHTTNNPKPRNLEFGYDLGGALVELATAKFLGTAWLGRNGGQYDPRLHDVAPNVEARYATNRGPLRVREKDRKWPPSTPIVLGWMDDVFNGQVVELVGWTSIGMALDYGKEYEYQCNFVYETNWERLNPLDTLKRKIQ